MSTETPLGWDSDCWEDEQRWRKLQLQYAIEALEEFRQDRYCVDGFPKLRVYLWSRTFLWKKPEEAPVRSFVIEGLKKQLTKKEYGYFKAAYLAYVKRRGAIDAWHFSTPDLF